MMRTLAFIDSVLDTSKRRKIGTEKDVGEGELQRFDNPLARADENHLESL